MPIALLERSIISVRGETARDFLGGLITNNLKSDLTFSALLTPQGKIIADFFVHRMADDHYLIETPVKFGKTLMLRLKMYKLRAKIELEDVSEQYDIYALWDGEGDAGQADPRHPDMGHRLIAESGSMSPEHTDTDYNVHRLGLGISESEWDFDSEQMFPSDANMDRLNGVDFKKGCFIGQEVVSRMHRKTNVRKRMGGLILGGEAKAGDELKDGDRTVGTVLHVHADQAMALLRLNRIAEADGDITIHGDPVQIREAVNGDQTK
jgi:folate-binding protein YgfZ